MAANQHDCIVIGAGFAGLCAAWQLVQQGQRPLVLEARGRIGGRCVTQQVRGEWFDFGGHWIGAHQPRIRKMIEDFGFKMKPQYDEGKHVVTILGQRHTYSGNISELSSYGEALSELERCVAIWDKEMMEFPIDRPQSAPKAKEWDNLLLSDWQKQNIKSPEAVVLMDILLWTIFTVTADQISYFWWLFYMRQGHGYNVLADIRGGAQQDKIVGGVGQVIQALADRVGRQNIQTDSPIRAIEQTATSVTVTTKDGRKFTAPFAIVTAPPAACDEIEFRPALPPKRQQLLKKYPMGTVIKVYVLYERHWWRENGLSGELLSDKEPLALMYDATTDKVPAFIGFICADKAQKWAEASQDDLKTAVINQIYEAFQIEDARKPLDVLVRPWTIEEPYSRGAYAGHTLPGALATLGDEISKPAGRIHWASTESAFDWGGYFEGAVEAGERVGKTVAELVKKGRAKL
eukprot:TRINITY_DN3837_c0_g1_i2.p1 TRINITY_DN3837_c0_g1~~TRINITY_DN3837_c0_g1_i2.p1  ORF type:complete len:469 (+),score=124.16 TRINITY_DN3837_c0_g1_i2:27-1409(+)